MMAFGKGGRVPSSWVCLGTQIVDAERSSSRPGTRQGRVDQRRSASTILFPWLGLCRERYQPDRTGQRVEEGRAQREGNTELLQREGREDGTERGMEKLGRGGREEGREGLAGLDLGR
eukprot:3623312-Rhodomonas_salina.1